MITSSNPQSGRHGLKAARVMRQPMVMGEERPVVGSSRGTR